ncbi:MAG: hypothetical protein A2Y79_13280 [Deltaproteobacteria bacterium RBG_13_43_22]|nr:MAG: hypothetical protein A2Y79_13280 [Deltaproteobacteria bacterium RBG_13_43_22]
MLEIWPGKEAHGLLVDNIKKRDLYRPNFKYLWLGLRYHGSFEKELQVFLWPILFPSVHFP